MNQFLRRIFRKQAKAEKKVDVEFEEFKDTFYLNPEARFFDVLKEGRHTKLLLWLDPSNGFSESQAFILLANEVTRRGVKIWEQTGITMNLDEGNGSSEISEFSRKSLGELATFLGFPITVYYRESIGSELKKADFLPTNS